MSLSKSSRSPQALLAALALLAGAAGPVRAAPDGKALFAQNCAACHQESGQGIKGAFPALAGDKIVLGPAPAMATVVLKGRGGMPSFAGQLSNADLAAVMTYVRSAWGNSAPPVTPALVAGLRPADAPEPAQGPVQAH